MQTSLTILLADDDADDRDFFVASLEEADEKIDCVAVENGDDALIYLSNEANKIPDFIFLDLRMPRMSGQECLEKIRADQRLKNIPIIIYTTSSDVNHSIHLMEEGATHFVTKPTNPDEIFYIISMILDEKWN